MGGGRWLTRSTPHYALGGAAGRAERERAYLKSEFTHYGHQRARHPLGGHGRRLTASGLSRDGGGCGARRWARDQDFWIRRAALLALLTGLRCGEGHVARLFSVQTWPSWIRDVAGARLTGSARCRGWGSCRMR
jgi:hypothetical protein